MGHRLQSKMLYFTAIHYTSRRFCAGIINKNEIKQLSSLTVMFVI